MKKKVIRKQFHIGILLFHLLLFLNIFSNSTLNHPLYHEIDQTFLDQDVINQNKENSPNSSLFNDGLLYNGNQNPLDINETASLFVDEQYSLGNGSETGYTNQNASYYLDSTHGWQGNYYNASVSGIADERNWVLNNEFGSSGGVTPTAHIVHINTSAPGYVAGQSGNPAVPANRIGSYNGNSCDYIRIHFVNVSTNYSVSYVSIYSYINPTYTLVENLTGELTNFITKWYNASILYITIHGDDLDTNGGYGYYSDYYEVYNGTQPPVNKNNWSYYYTNGNPSYPGRFSGGLGKQGNHSAVWSSLKGFYFSGGSYYFAGDRSGYSQNLTIPRGNVVNAWISMDYNVIQGVGSNEMFLYIEINNQIIYYIGMRTITELGLRQWHNTGLINILLWQNTTQVFNGPLTSQNLNLSFGIQTQASSGYTGFPFRENQTAYFDNVKLILKSEANSTQSDINITFDDQTLTEVGTDHSGSFGWGYSDYNQSNTWISNPINILMKTNATKIEYRLKSTMDAFHSINSFNQPNGIYGTTLSILTNGSILWDFYHNTYTPPQYSNFALTISKSQDWTMMSAKDPTGIETPYTGGSAFDTFFGINSSYAYFPGWWHFTAKSSNLILKNDTQLWNGTNWSNYTDLLTSIPIYNVNQEIRFQSSLDFTKGSITDVQSTWANLTIYSPDENVWFTQAIHPDSLGKIQFENLSIGAINTTAGIYYYKILWTNGTSAGGLNGTYEVRHNLQYHLFYPKDAEFDLVSEKIYGDVISVRIKLNDSDNGQLVSNSIIQYNWSDGQHNLVDVGVGMYDGSLDTVQLAHQGYYQINFNISRSGYYNISFILQLYLVRETNFRLIDIDQMIQLGNNFTMELEFNSKLENLGVNDTDIYLNLSSSEYTVIVGTEDGHYILNISTDSFTQTGMIYLQINASKEDFQNQTLIQGIQILPIEVNFQIFINSIDCSINKTAQVKLNKMLNITVNAISASDSSYILGANMQIRDDNEEFQENMQLIASYYQLLLNSSKLGIGTHYLTILFNKNNYETTSATIQLTVEQLGIRATLSGKNTTIIQDLKSVFEVNVLLQDFETNSSILGANVSYSWAFGTGYLLDFGNGSYWFNETVPSKEGSYEIRITFNFGAEYKTETIIITLVGRQSMNNTLRNLWWIAIPVVLMLILLFGVVIKQNVINPKRRLLRKSLEQKTQILDDMLNLQALMVIQKSSGLLLYNHVFNIKSQIEENLFTGFLQAIMLFSSNISTGKKMEMKDGKIISTKSESLEFSHNKFNILVIDGNEIRVAVVLQSRSSAQLKLKVQQYINEFELLFGEIVANWSGNTDMFDQVSNQLAERIFSLDLIRNYTLTNSSILGEMIHEIVKPNTIFAYVYHIIETLSKEQRIFNLSTVLSLVSEDNRLDAKDLILQLIDKRLIVPAKKSEVKEKQIEEEITKLAQN